MGLVGLSCDSVFLKKYWIYPKAPLSSNLKSNRKNIEKWLESCPAAFFQSVHKLENQLFFSL